MNKNAGRLFKLFENSTWFLAFGVKRWVLPSVLCSTAPSNHFPNHMCAALWKQITNSFSFNLAVGVEPRKSRGAWANSWKKLFVNLWYLLYSSNRFSDTVACKPLCDDGIKSTNCPSHFHFKERGMCVFKNHTSLEIGSIKTSHGAFSSGNPLYEAIMDQWRLM